MIQFGLGKQPSAGDLGARNRALGDQFINLALLEAEILGGFRRGEQTHCMFAIN